MAKPVYYRRMFSISVPDACASEFIEQNKIEEVKECCEVVLNRFDCEAMFRSTNSGKLEDVTRVIVKELYLVHKCLEVIGEGLMTGVMMNSMNISIEALETGYRIESKPLEDAMVEYMKHIVKTTNWWSSNGSDLAKMAKQMRTIEKVQSV